VSYVYKALIRRRETGAVEVSATRGHRPRKLSPAQEAALAAQIAARPDITLATLKSWLEAEHGVRLSNGALWAAVDRLGLTFKKKNCAPLSRSVRTSSPGARSGTLPGPTSLLSAWCSSTRSG